MQTKFPLLPVLLLILWPQSARAADVPDRPRIVADQLAILKDGHDDHRATACRVLGDLGPSARAAVPDLIAALANPNFQNRSEIPVNLLKIAPADPAVIKAVLAALADPDQYTRAAAVNALGDNGPADRATVLAIARCLSGKDGYDTTCAVDALIKLGPDAAPAIPLLIDVLKNPEGPLRTRAQWVLAAIGPAARAAAVPAIAPLLADGEPAARQVAADSLGRLGGPLPRDVAAALAKLAADPDPKLRTHAAFALGRAGEPDSALPAPANAAAPTDADRLLRTAHALGALAGKESTGPATVAKLLAVTRGEDGPVLCDLAGDAVRAGGAAALPALTAALSSDNYEVRGAAALSLGSLARAPRIRASPHAPAAVRALAAALNDPEPGVRGGAGIALGSFADPSTLAAAIDTLRHADWDARSDALMALRGYMADPVAAPAAVAAITSSLADDNRYVRFTAAYVLRAYGPQAAPAVPALVKLLSDRDDREIAMPPLRRPLKPTEKEQLEHSSRVFKTVRACDSAAQALGEIGPAARAAVPALLAQLNDPNGAGRRKVIEALGAIGPDAAAAVPALAAARATDQPNFYVTQALAKIGDPGVRALVTALRTGKDADTYAITENLAKCGPAAIPLIRPALDDPDPSVRRDAARIIATIERRTTRATP